MQERAGRMWSKSEHEIPASEFEQRIEQVRQFTQERNLSAVVAYSSPKIHQWSQTGHVGYLTNWSNLDRIVDTVVVVPREGQAVLLVAGVEFMFEQIEEVSWIGDIRLVSSPDPRAVSGAYDLGVAGEEATRGALSFGAEVDRIIKDNGCDGQPVGIAGVEAMPWTIHSDISASVSGGIADVPDIVADLRQTKSPQEIPLLRKAAEISDLSYQTMMDVLEEGMLGYELTAEMDRTAKRNGADIVYHCMHSAPDGDLRAGKLSIKAHNLPLRRGDYVNVNGYIVYKGYWIQGDRFGTIGPSLGSTAAELAEANLSVQDEVLAAIRPGLPIAEMLQIGTRAAERLGSEIQGGRIGHGQGLDYSERPFLIAGSSETLRPGHVFVLHVCLALRGTNILINPIADLCHVTEDGVEVLNKFPRGLFHA